MTAPWAKTLSQPAQRPFPSPLPGKVPSHKSPGPAQPKPRHSWRCRLPPLTVAGLSVSPRIALSTRLCMPRHGLRR